jgi:hypothetical protein
MAGFPTTFSKLAVGAWFRFPGGSTLCKKVNATKAQHEPTPQGVEGIPFKVPSDEPVVMLPR